MKRGGTAIGAILGLVVGWVLAGGPGPRYVGAQPPTSPTRFAVSAYAAAAGANVHHGCYIIDTATGETWHTLQGGQLSKVSGPIR